MQSYIQYYIQKEDEHLLRLRNPQGQIKNAGTKHQASPCRAIDIQDNHRNYNQRNRFNERHSHWEHRQYRQPRILINISNLHYSVTREQLQELCERYGKVKTCRIQWDKMGRSNEKATVQYFSRIDSENAYQGIKGAIFEDQKIEVQLVEDESFPSKRHEIKKNYGNRFRQHSNNFKPRYK